MIKSQWYVKCSLMCQKALEVVENGDLKIIPDIHHVSWKRYLEGSRDWCISRQLWWGHRIPAYFVLIDDLSISKGDLIDDRYWVAAYTEGEAICKAAVNFNVDISKITVKQDEDVLDTWFSAGLWPFAITGWPEQTRDFEQFFPKCHWMCCHVPLFAAANKFWGLISEQAIEALHQKISEDEKRFCRMRDLTRISETIMKRSYVRNCLHDLNISDTMFPV